MKYCDNPRWENCWCSKAETSKVMRDAKRVPSQHERAAPCKRGTKKIEDPLFSWGSGDPSPKDGDRHPSYASMYVLRYLGGIFLIGMFKYHLTSSSGQNSRLRPSINISYVRQPFMHTQGDERRSFGETSCVLCTLHEEMQGGVSCRVTAGK